MLQVEDIKKRYGFVKALEGVTLDLSKGEILTILGPSACGKTTLLRIIAGFEKPDSGQVRIGGLEVSSRKSLLPPYKRNLSMIFQDLALWPHMTVRENIKFVLEKNGLPKKIPEQEIRDLVEKINLTGNENRYPHELSGGEKQRLAIARALGSKSTYLLMDEPFSNLDPILKDELKNVIQSLKEGSHIGIIYVTHNVDEALSLGDRIAVMNQGQIEQTGSPEGVIQSPKNEFVRRFLGAK